MDAVLSWGAAALFIGPILAGVALVLFRWILNNGYFVHALLVGLALSGAYYFPRPSSAPSPTPTPTKKGKAGSSWRPPPVLIVRLTS